MSSHKASLLALFSLLVLLCALLYKKHHDDLIHAKLDQTLSSLLQVEQSFAVNAESRVALGYGSCVDVVSSARNVITEYSEPPKEMKAFAIIRNEDELIQSFAYFYVRGAAAERYISNSSLFDELVRRARSKSDREILGGNAAIMATRFFKEGVHQILLGSRKSSHLHQFLPPEIQIASQSDPSDSDVHLVIEYPSGDSWGSLSSPRANRFIVHSDKSNPMIKGMEEFHDRLSDFNPNLFVVSGLQMLDNFPFLANEGSDRVDKLAAHIQDLKMNKPSVKVHFEMASFTDLKLLKQIVNDVIPFVDSLGMNEQELPNLRSIFSIGNITLVADSYPRTAVVLDQMRDVFIHADQLSSGRISRMHVHTLAFQAVLVRKGSEWKNTRAAATKSALTAHRHTCGSDVIDVAKARLIMDDSFTTTNGASKLRIQFDPKFPVPCWEETIANSAVQICIAPVLVCTRVLLTAGGGDNVSAAGLVVQL